MRLVALIILVPVSLNFPSPYPPPSPPPFPGDEIHNVGRRRVGVGIHIEGGEAAREGRSIMRRGIKINPYRFKRMQNLKPS